MSLPVSRDPDENPPALEPKRFSDHERRIVLALFATTMPPSKRFPKTAEELDYVGRLERFFLDLPDYALPGFRSVLWAMERGALLRWLRPFSRLRPEQQARYIDWMDYGAPPQIRQSFKAFMGVLKLVRYSMPDFFEGLRYRADAVRPAGQKLPRAQLGPGVCDGRELTGETRIEADVIVIGTGAGGAVVGKELQERGYSVAFLEEGDYFTKVDFNRRSLDMTTLLYREAGLIAALGKPGIVLPLGRTVGGTTTINSGTCFRTPDAVLERWHDELHLPFTPAQMVPYFEKVEAALQVAPVAEEVLGKVGRIIRRGCEKLGYSSGPLARNAKDCVGSGVCCFGCPTGAKQAMNVSYMPWAIESGARVYTGARVENLLVEDGRIRAVVARTAGGGTLVARGKAVVVACGALLTPVLLRRNGLCTRSGALGRFLSIHPATKEVALFDEEVRSWEGVPQGYQINHFHEEGILFEGIAVPPDFGSLAASFTGARLSEFMANFDRMAAFGLMVADTSRGRVHVGPGGKPVIVYNVNDADKKKLQRGMAILARVFLAAGAQKVYPGIVGYPEITDLAGATALENANVSTYNLDLAAFHPLGTARMGTRAEDSVVGPDFETHDVRDLFVVDGSIFPTSLGVNPQITIMAFATLAAERIAARLG